MNDMLLHACSVIVVLIVCFMRNSCTLYRSQMPWQHIYFLESWYWKTIIGEMSTTKMATETQYSINMVKGKRYSSNYTIPISFYNTDWSIIWTGGAGREKNTTTHLENYVFASVIWISVCSELQLVDLSCMSLDKRGYYLTKNVIQVLKRIASTRWHTVGHCSAASLNTQMLYLKGYW